MGNPVERTRLFRMLDEAVRRRLTLVIGPPGAGKSVLLATWARSRAQQLPGPLAWLTLDEEDNAPERLCRHLVAAMRQAGAGGRSPMQYMSQTAWRDGSVSALVHDMGSLRTPVVLVLDDFHELRPGPAHTMVLQLVRHAPPALRLVLAARGEPGLPLHKLRAARELAEVRGSDLAFTVTEAGELFTRTGFGLTPDQTAAVTRHSGGWAIALRLATRLGPVGDGCLSRRLTGWSEVTRLCSDFLVRELLERLPPADQELLLRCSVLDRLNASLVRDVTGRADAGLMLRRLSSEQDLLRQEDEWTYEQNPLFRQLFTQELIARHGRAAAAEVRRAAGRWRTVHGRANQARRRAAEVRLPAPFAEGPGADGPHTVEAAGSAEAPDAPEVADVVGSADVPDVPDVLTSSEDEVLRLLPTRLTLQQIAARRHVSINTVKTQVKRIYVKLQVRDRQEAVCAARHYGLL
ncbi:AAA family ATPase [Streptomyces sp. NPDC058773]|uniref:helix-turn-helix transcriptional regulator n=1 Tax=Streptomyces sp. NPDC058773 TaxID=3346632 RepID=UPI0036CBE21A